MGTLSRDLNVLENGGRPSQLPHLAARRYPERHSATLVRDAGLVGEKKAEALAIDPFGADDKTHAATSLDVSAGLLLADHRVQTSGAIRPGRLVTK